MIERININQLLFFWLIGVIVAGCAMWNFETKITAIAGMAAAFTALIASLIAYKAAIAKVTSDETRATKVEAAETKALHLVVERLARNLYSDSRHMLYLLSLNHTKGAIQECLKYDKPTKSLFLIEAYKRSAILDPKVVTHMSLMEFRLDAALQYSISLIEEKLNLEEEDESVANDTNWLHEDYKNLDETYRDLAEAARETAALAARHIGQEVREKDDVLEGLLKMQTDFEPLVSKKPYIAPPTTLPSEESNL